MAINGVSAAGTSKKGELLDRITGCRLLSPLAISRSEAHHDTLHESEQQGAVPPPQRQRQQELGPSPLQTVMSIRLEDLVSLGWLPQGPRQQHSEISSIFRLPRRPAKSAPSAVAAVSPAGDGDRPASGGCGGPAMGPAAAPDAGTACPTFPAPASCPMSLLVTAAGAHRGQVKRGASLLDSPLVPDEYSQAGNAKRMKVNFPHFHTTITGEGGGALRQDEAIRPLGRGASMQSIQTSRVE